ncbi:MAG: zf-HC2 domain-containing protein [Verrucomicrobia bacterium]|nr:zf-HC2 domain-containing protein [Verrucomicrobiota bacterium]
MNVKWLWNQCWRYEVKLSLLAADVLAAQERGGVQAHLDVCPACQARFAELKAVVGRGEQLRSALPQVEPSVALRRRWLTAVRGSAQREIPVASGVIWRSGRRLAWGSLAAMWALVLFFRFSAPDAPRPASLAAAPPSLREVLLVLKVEPRDSPTRASAGDPTKNVPRQPDALPPRSQRPGADAAKRSEAV